VWCWSYIGLTYFEPHVLVWITFLTWASFYAAGGGRNGLAKSISSGIVGVLASAAVLWVDNRLSSGAYHLLVLSLLLGILGWFLCVISAIRLLSSIPASFIGASAFFGAGSPMDIKLVWVLTSVVVGAILGFTSQTLAGLLSVTGGEAISAPRRRRQGFWRS
jgi:hypothetical protein